MLCMFVIDQSGFQVNDLQVNYREFCSPGVCLSHMYIAVEDSLQREYIQRILGVQFMSESRSRILLQECIISPHIKNEKLYSVDK